MRYVSIDSATNSSSAPRRIRTALARLRNRSNIVVKTPVCEGNTSLYRPGGVACPEQPASRLLLFFRRLHDGVQGGNVLQLRRRALECPDIGVDILSLLVGHRIFAEIGHRSGRHQRRHVRPPPQKRKEALLGCEVSPAADEWPRPGLAVVAVACVAAEGVIQ